MLRAITLGKRFRRGRVALDDVSFRVDDGEVCTLVGRNGAGKTTTIHCFLDLVRPDTGAAEVDGRVVAASPVAARRDVAYLAEQVAVYPALTGRENVRFFVRLHGRACTRAAAGETLERLGLPAEAVDRPVRTYSKGMRQKVGLATAVACGVRNLILDEPTSGLDPGAALDLMTLLRTVSRSGCAVLTSSHDLARAARVTDTVVCLDGGRVVAAARVDGIGGDRLEAWYGAALGGTA